jgi:hypothetical protein
LVSVFLARASSSPDEVYQGAEVFNSTTMRVPIRVAVSNKSLQPVTTLSECSGEGSLQRNVTSFDCVMGPIAFPEIFATDPRACLWE